MQSFLEAIPPCLQRPCVSKPLSALLPAPCSLVLGLSAVMDVWQRVWWDGAGEDGDGLQVPVHIPFGRPGMGGEMLGALDDGLLCLSHLLACVCAV